MGVEGEASRDGAGHGEPDDDELDVVIDLREGALRRRRVDGEDVVPREHRVRVAFRSGRFRRRF